MKTSRIPKLIVTVLGAMLACGLAVTQAADSGSLAPGTVIRDYDVTVPPSQDHAFRKGIQHWIKCLRDHGSAQAFYAYDAETGDTDRYAFLVPHGSWGQIGRHTAAGKACADTFDRSIAPHFTDAASVIFQVDAKITYDPDQSPPTMPLWWVASYRIKPGKAHEFFGALKAFAAAAAKTNWDGHFIGYDVWGGGQGSPQFMLVWPNKSWADAGTKTTPPPRKMMQNVYGKAAESALYHEFSHAIRDQWSSIWSYDKKLSFVPAKGR